MANTNYPSSSTSETRSTSSSNSNTKNIVIGALAVILLGTWGYFLYDKNKSNEQIQVKSAEVTTATTARDSVQSAYNEALTRLDSLTGSNNSLQGQLTDRQTEIVKLKNQINKIVNNKNATASDLARAKRLINELNGKISNLEAEVARLMGENQQLAATNTVLHQEKQTLETNLQVATTEKEELAKTVDVGSTFSASNINIKALNEKGNGKEKETTTAKRVDKLIVSFDVENRIAKSGPADLYVIVTAPNGQVISDPSLGSAVLSTRQDGDKPFTYKTTLEYEQGTRKTIQVPLRQQHFQTGNYKIEIYQNGFKIAEGVKSLKKGGLFS
jgi:predicted nuclease with TOPRIM domain